MGGQPCGAALEKLAPTGLADYDGVAFVQHHRRPAHTRSNRVSRLDQSCGHGFIGIHAASDTFHHWPGYIDMLGGEFKHHGRQVSVDCLTQDPAELATAGLPLKCRTIQQEEIYQFTNYDPAKVHDLLILDKHPETGAPGHYGVSWCKHYGAVTAAFFTPRSAIGKTCGTPTPTCLIARTPSKSPRPIRPMFWAASNGRSV